MRPFCTGLLLLALSSLVTSVAAQAAPVAEVLPFDAEGGSEMAAGPGEIRIRFDQDMDSGMSLTKIELEFPRLPRPARWADARNLILRVDLDPDRAYGFAINGSGFEGFRSRAGQVAASRTIRFRSGGGRLLEAKEKAATIARLREALAHDYAYRDLQGVGADFALDEKALLAARTPGAFGEILARELSRIPDPHLSLRLGDRILPGYQRTHWVANAAAPVIARKIGNWQKLTPSCARAEIEGGIRYVMLATLQDEASVTAAIAAIRAEPAPRAYVIDLRLNGGGDEKEARRLAGLFTGERILYARHRSVDREASGGFAPEQERWLEPLAGTEAIAKPVAVLMGQGCLSSAEALLLMFRAIPGAELVGDRSGGSSGNPRPIALGCDLRLELPSWIALDADGRPFEGTGIQPDVSVPTTTDDLKAGRDPVLDRALERLRSRLAR